MRFALGPAGIAIAPWPVWRTPFSPACAPRPTSLRRKQGGCLSIQHPPAVWRPSRPSAASRPPEPARGSSPPLPPALGCGSESGRCPGLVALASRSSGPR
ncbi:MAG TPA: hypothetical protein DEP84_36535, partial [Chloroflexi bacterium]|nr:hypothetical protein [Chloroflexota bacterium]